MRVLDLFCGVGGASMGYSLAGFEVVGVDINPQPRYPFSFIQADAIDWMRRNQMSDFFLEFDLVHASPPCQAYSTLRASHPDREYVDLIEPTREVLKLSGLPYVIENVPGSPLDNPVVLCGTQFDLRTFTEQRGEVWLRRHRLFESSIPLPEPPPCDHKGRRTIGVYGHGGGVYRPGLRGWKGSFEERAKVMQIHWANRKELAQAIPPAYTRWIGNQIRLSLERQERL